MYPEVLLTLAALSVLYATEQWLGWLAAAGLIGWLLGRAARLGEDADGLAARVRHLESLLATREPRAETDRAGASAATSADAAGPAEPPRPSSPVSASPAAARAREVAWLDPLLRRIPWRRIRRTNPLAALGILILFFGVGFLLKYAAENALLPVQMRLAGAALGGAALLGIAWRLRRAPGRRTYALVLAGGGYGLLYMTTFAAFRLYELMPPGLALPLLVAIGTATAATAVFGNALSLAVLGVSGGFLAPLLASTGSGSHVALFTYYLFLNGAVFAIAWHRSWRLLNLTGFGFTFGIGTLWGAQYYRPAYFASVEPFLVVSFLLYVAIAVLFAWRRRPTLRSPVDGSLVFGPPLMGFALQYGLVRDFEYGMAWSAVGLGIFYLLLWRGLRHAPARLGALPFAFAALGTGFATLAVPLAFDGRLTSVLWALEGVGLVWVGLHQGQWLARVTGLALQGLSAAAFLIAAGDLRGPVPVLNAFFSGGALLALAALAIGMAYARQRTAIGPRETPVERGALSWGLLWWFGIGALEIAEHAARGLAAPLAVAGIAASSLALHTGGRRLHWPALAASARSGLVLLWLAVPAALHDGGHFFAHGGWLAWGFALTAHYFVLARHEARPLSTLNRLEHAAGLWLLALLAAHEAHWYAERLAPGAETWQLAAPALAVALLLGTACLWPAWTALRRRHPAYLAWAAPVPLAGLALWSLATAESPGGLHGLAYLPLLNPLDFAQALVPLLLLAWAGAAQRLHAGGAGAIVWTRRAAWAVGFLTVNLLIARSVHHLGGVPYHAPALFGSVLFQAAMSIAWTLLALGTAAFAARRARRDAWFAGVALLGAVVVKLFTVDLSGSGSVERIVSFLGVGVLVLLLAYLAPLPPAGGTLRAAERP